MMVLFLGFSSFYVLVYSKRCSFYFSLLDTPLGYRFIFSFPKKYLVLALYGMESGWLASSRWEMSGMKWTLSLVGVIIYVAYLCIWVEQKKICTKNNFGFWNYEKLRNIWQFTYFCVWTFYDDCIFLTFPNSSNTIMLYFNLLFFTCWLYRNAMLYLHFLGLKQKAIKMSSWNIQRRGT